MVFQQFALFPWRTVADNVGFGLELAGISDNERKDRINKQLSLVGLDLQWANKFPHELSWGMQQRVGLARAFATEAPILLMDEPFSALDPLIRTKLQDELLQLQKTLKKTIIFVSHDLEEALKLGSHISIMEEGRIIQTGKPEDIVLRPVKDYVGEFVANVNALNVLSGWNIMHRVNELEQDAEGWIWLDRGKTTRFLMDNNNFVTAIERNGQAGVWVDCNNINKSLGKRGHSVFRASPATPLKTLMLAMHLDDMAPVALFHDDNTFAGAICSRDVLRAMSKIFHEEG